MASSGSCYMVTWTIFKKPSLGGRPNTKPGDIDTLNVHTIVDLFYFFMCEDPHERDFIEIRLGWEPITSDFKVHTTLEGPRLHHMILGVCRDRIWTLSFGLSQFHGHRSWLLARVWSGPWDISWSQKFSEENFYQDHNKNLKSYWKNDFLYIRVAESVFLNYTRQEVSKYRPLL